MPGHFTHTYPTHTPISSTYDAPLLKAVPAQKRQSSEKSKRHMPRERLQELGAAALSDIELIAILLGSGLPGHDVFALARSLLDHFGSLRAMLNATPDDLKQQRGIGPAKSAVLTAVIEIARRTLTEQAREKPFFDSPGTVEDYLRLKIGACPQEIFICLFLDARHRLLHAEETFRGSITRISVYPREIVRQALKLNAAGLIVAHNHPSGAVEPSESDRQLTRVLCNSLALIEVRVLDHLIIGGNAVFSFAQAGWI